MINNTNSYWLDTADPPDYPALHGEHKCDTAIIGGGLTGVTAAILLAQKGLKSVLLEADRLAMGTSGFTTAKVTVQHGLKYHMIASRLSEKSALLYYKANQLGLEKIAQLVADLRIDCDFTSGLPSYVYATTEKEAKEIELEYHALHKLDIACRLKDSTPLPFPVLSAIVMDDQAVFHPVKYLYSLAEHAKSHCDIYEHTNVERVEVADNERPYIIRTNDGTLYADNIILATNYPVMDMPGLYFLKLHQERSYIIANRAGDTDLEGLYINAGDPVNSYRMHYAKTGNMLLIGGYDHRTGQKEHTEENYDKLVRLMQDQFSIEGQPDYLWSAQDTVPLDDIPYIGAISPKLPGIFVACGYNKWGMTSSNMAAQLVVALLTGDKAAPIMEAKELFSPHRFTPQASAKEFITHGVTVVMDFLAGNLGVPAGDPAELKEGEGRVLSHKGVSMAAYKDENGRVHAYNHHCTHIGCPVHWNDREKSWDCPCHGSRFSTEGEILTGPAKRPLEKIEIEEE